MRWFARRLPKRLNGRLRFTEQGESIQQSYGLRPIAMRTLERAFNALATTTSARRQGKFKTDTDEHLAIAAEIATGEPRGLSQARACASRSSTTTSAPSRRSM